MKQIIIIILLSVLGIFSSCTRVGTDDTIEEYVTFSDINAIPMHNNAVITNIANNHKRRLSLTSEIALNINSRDTFFVIYERVGQSKHMYYSIKSIDDKP